MTQAQQIRARAYFEGMGALGLTTTQTITATVGGGLLAAAPFTGPAAPFVALAGGLTELIGGLFKPDLTKIQATNIVNQIEAQYLKPNLAQWQALSPDQKTVSAQQAALANFTAAWNGVLQGCGNPQLGTAGQACISDRQSGACHWTTDGQTPGVPPNCGNWFVWYHDPIANDPNVIPDPVSGSSTGAETGTVTNEISNALGGISPLWIGLGLIAAALLVTD